MKSRWRFRLDGNRAILLALIAVLCGGGLAAFFALQWQSIPPAELLTQARAALERNEYDRAEELAAAIEPDHHLWVQGRLLAGEAAMRTGRYQAAIEHFSSIPRDESEDALLAAFSLAEVCRAFGRLSDAERHFRYVLERQPGNAHAHMRLAFLLHVTGRSWESAPHFMFLVKHGAWTLDSLVLLGDLGRPMDQSDYLQRCAKNAPDDPLVRLGLATDAITQGHSDEARRLLADVIEQAPEQIAAHAMLGELLVDADSEIFLRWHAALPAAADDHPDIWYVRGLWARRRGSPRVAARCFWETVRREPTHRRANYQLSQVLASLDEPSGTEFGERSSQLYELTRSLNDTLRSEGKSEVAMKRVTELLEQTGRVWEAWAWAQTAAEAFPYATWARQTVGRLVALLKEDTPRTLPTANLALKHDLSSYPSYEELLSSVTPEKPLASVAPGASTIRFREHAREVGIDFVYFSSPDPSTTGVRMFEQNGGGAAVLDFDLDGWPDLYFTQGAPWKHGDRTATPTARYIDRIYRNLGGVSFADVALHCGLGDRAYSQGGSAADFNNDGFPDLYVANIGPNVLYRNNGDGTLSDVTREAGLDGDAWTASCVIVDLNADGCPDIYDVNYLQGASLYEILCGGRTCSPSVFNGAPDPLHLSRGNGTFQFIPQPFPESEGKGLGVVAADLLGTGRPSLLIANDQVANFLLVSDPSGDPSSLALRDEGFLRGFAYTEDGIAMGSMGIAADDVDGDGRIDFSVTNFEDEANTLYLQHADGLFVEGTNAAGLVAPSLPMVGWGTQFLDADLDGDPDLVIANGHVDDRRSEGFDYQMRPQFFRNSGGGRFEELFADEIGEYFDRKYLGRGLARLDWNRDGRMDFVVSNIEDQASLVTNESTGVGRFLNLRLHATTTARDAVGTVVEVVAGERRWTKQLIAGDGFMASNERVLQFGLGDASSVEEVLVRWPSGEITTLRDLPVDTTIQLIEGSPRFLERPAAPGGTGRS